jgi:hypothetical protein
MVYASASLVKRGGMALMRKLVRFTLNEVIDRFGFNKFSRRK